MGNYDANGYQVHNDDISNVLILNKKSISNHENQLFQAELEKFRPHQNRLLQATHKQSTLMKELTKTYGNLLQDKRVRSEQSKYESYNRQRSMVLTRYGKIFQAFNDLIDGLMRAQSFYSEMKDTVESLEKNVETFVSNRRSEGAQLLSQIERDKASTAGSQADRERDRLRELMERMSVDPSSSSPTRSSSSRPPPLSRPSQYNDSYPSAKSPPLSPPNYSKPPTMPSIISRSPAASYQNYPQYTQPLEPHRQDPSRNLSAYGGPNPMGDPYNPMAYPYQTPASPPPSQTSSYYSNPTPQPHQQYPPQGQYLPQGYVPPPPPPGPPPGSQQMNFAIPGAAYPSGPGGYAYHQPSKQGNGSVQPGQAQAQAQNDPWAGLNAWK